MGVTPVAQRLFGPAWTRTPQEREQARYVRHAELKAWLRAAGRSGPWLAIDNDPSLFEPRCQRLVVCDSSVGLTADRLVELGNLVTSSVIARAHERFEQQVRAGERDSLAGGHPGVLGKGRPLQPVDLADFPVALRRCSSSRMMRGMVTGLLASKR